MLKSPLSVLLIVLLCSCTASRKFDFKSAYKFRYLQYNPEPITDSVPPLLVSAEKHAFTPSGQPAIPEPNFRRKIISIPNKAISRTKNEQTGDKQEYGNSLTAVKYAAGKTAVIPFKTYKKTGIKQTKSTEGFGDLHPAFQGFIFVALGFGLIVAGSLITGIQVLPLVLIVGGIALAVFGFIKIFRQL